MKRGLVVRKPFLLLLCCALSCPAFAGDARLEHSRSIVREFGGALKQQLVGALKSGGPVQAIAVCKEVAPTIAARLSSEHGAKVGRTSLKIRNPANRADAWQTEVLGDFDRMNVAGQAVESLEHFVTFDDGSARYMKAIPAQAVCLGCHGESLLPEAAGSLKTHYPDDEATGYRVGDIRGAFRIDWPVP